VEKIMGNKTFPFTVYPMMQDNYGDRLAGYDVIIRTRDPWVTGLSHIIFEVRKLLRKEGITPIMAYPSLPIDNEVMVFLVVDREERSLEETDRIVFSLANTVKGIKSIEKSGRYRNIVYAKNFSPLTFLGGRSIIFGPASLKGVIVDSRKELGNNVARMLLSIIGRSLGEAVYEYYKGLGKFERISETLEFLKMILMTAGWGIVENYEVEKDQIIISVKDLWESEVLEKAGLNDNPSYFMGTLAGFFSKVFDKEVRVNLVIKRKKNGRIECTFSITR
jgi:predicted hydrocarbon binding protein